MKLTSSRRSTGFTLIELLVVIAIISILASMLFPTFARAREMAHKTVCSSNLQQIGLGIMQYTQDYDERFPSAYPFWDDADGSTPGFQSHPRSDTLVAVLDPYIKSDQIWICSSWQGVYGGSSNYLGDYSFITNPDNNVIGVPGQTPSIDAASLAAVGGGSVYPLLWCGIAPEQTADGNGAMNAHNAQSDAKWRAGAPASLPILYADGHAKAPVMSYGLFTNMYDTIARGGGN